MTPITMPDMFASGDTFVTQDVRVTRMFGMGGPPEGQLAARIMF